MHKGASHPVLTRSSCCHRVSLAEHLVGKPAQASYVAVVPLIIRKDTAGAGNAPLEQLHADDLLKVGTVARVVQVSRSPQVCVHSSVCVCVHGFAKGLLVYHA